MSDIAQERLLKLAKELQERQKFWRIKQFVPYGWQERFIEASSTCAQVLAMTGNRCGKTFCGGAIMAIHLTGLYPEWWVGKRWDRPIQAWAAGISTDTTRDILQSELLGQWNDPSKYGTGAIPKELIHDTVNKVGIPNAVQAILVKHVSGGISTVVFKSYEMSQDKFMGTAIDLIWLDEECPKDIYTQCVTRTATTGGIVMLTFTPEHGLTDIVKDFMYDLKEGQFMVTASWDDAPHLDEDVKQQLMSVYTEAERQMRVSGQPSIGSGVVFPIKEEDVVIDPIAIPDHWFRIIGIDLGYDHPNAVANVAWDNESNIFYLYGEYSKSGDRLSDHANAIRAAGGVDIPVVVPHDAFKHDGPNSGRKYIDLYKDYGLNMVYQPFSNPPAADGKPGGNSVEYGVNFMMRAFQEGRLKIFRSCPQFLQEMKIYHRKDGKIVDKHDDLISATRYAILMMSRYGKPGGQTSSGGYYYSSNKPLIPSWMDSII